eukprot:16439206-Heterocapsa_arctica.AAC.1
MQARGGEKIVESPDTYIIGITALMIASVVANSGGFFGPCRVQFLAVWPDAAALASGGKKVAATGSQRSSPLARAAFNSDAQVSIRLSRTGQSASHPSSQPAGRPASQRDRTPLQGCITTPLQNTITITLYYYYYPPQDC